MSAIAVTLARDPRRESGFSLIEVMVAMGLGVLILGGTMSVLHDAIAANDQIVRRTSTNTTLRDAMDLMVRDFLQVGSGLPPGHAVLIPSGTGSLQVRLPGPPGTAWTTAAGDTELAAVIPGPGRGPVVDGVASDTVTVLTADNNFTDVSLTAVTATTVDVAAGPVLDAGPDRVVAGQLMMITKGSTTTLVQVTAVNATSRRLTFAINDSLQLNQTAAVVGTLGALNASSPANTPANTKITRIRMISYYLDATTPTPRLVRRINNGNATTFNNTLGTAVGEGIESLRLSYDLTDGLANPSGVRFSAADRAGTGACTPNPCMFNQIRKINVTLGFRSQNTEDPHVKVYRNALTSQVSLRGMAFLNEYQAP